MCGRVVCIGDSITEGVGDESSVGWVGRVSASLAGRRGDNMPWRLLNLGVAGDTSIDIKHRLCSEALYRNPDMLIIAAGINDTAYKIWPDRGGSKVDFHNSRFTWREVFMILKNHRFPILFIGPTPVDEDKLPNIWRPFDDKDKGTDLSNSTIAKYNEMLKEEVDKAGYIYLDMWNSLNHTSYIKTLNDGLHPNQAGYDMMASIIEPELTDCLSKIDLA